MAIVYKIDVLKALKEKGYSTYVLRKNKIMGEATLQKIRCGFPVSLNNISLLCSLLDCDISDLLKYVAD